MSKTKLEFADWKQKVDDVLTHWLGLTSDDLPDCPYSDWHEQG